MNSTLNKMIGVKRGLPLNWMRRLGTFAAASSGHNSTNAVISTLPTATLAARAKNEIDKSQSRIIVNTMCLHQESADQQSARWKFKTISLLPINALSIIILLLPQMLSAQTPTVNEVLIKARIAWDGIKTYDATFDVYHLLSKRNPTNNFREAWSKSGEGIGFYRFQDLTPPNGIHTVPYLQIRNSSGTWEIVTNGVFKRAFDDEYRREEPFQPDFQIPTNQAFDAHVAQDEINGMPCFVITTVENANLKHLGAPLTTSYYIAKTNYLVYAEIVKTSGNILNKSVITSLQINGSLDDTLFAIPFGLQKIIVTNQSQRFAYTLESVKAVDEAKEYIKLPGGAGFRIPIRGLVLASLFLTTFTALFYVYKIRKSSK